MQSKYAVDAIEHCPRLVDFVINQALPKRIGST